jgi:hypothetical protein
VAGAPGCSQTARAGNRRFGWSNAARPYKSTIQTRFAIGNAKAASPPRAGPDGRDGEALVHTAARVAEALDDGLRDRAGGFPHAATAYSGEGDVGRRADLAARVRREVADEPAARARPQRLGAVGVRQAPVCELPPRAGARRIRLLSALRTHTKAPYKTDFTVGDAKAAWLPRAGPDGDLLDRLSRGAAQRQATADALAYHAAQVWRRAVPWLRDARLADRPELRGEVVGLAAARGGDAFSGTTRPPYGSTKDPAV